MSRKSALLDANVLVSYLLAPLSRSPPSQVVAAAITGEYKAIIPAQVFAEHRQVFDSKRGLRGRVTSAQIDELEEIFREVGHTLEVNNIHHQPLSRDPRDDYLIVAAILANAEFVVTGDLDLLVLAEAVEQPRIVTPRRFLELLAEN